MATLSENTTQATEDFDAIRQAINIEDITIQDATIHYNYIGE